jgi:hypothetical protein
MPRTVPIAIGAGVLSALIFALFLTGSPLAFIVSPFTMLPLLLVGLSSSALVSGVAAVSGVLVIGLIGGSLSLAALYAAAEAVPAVGLSRLALRRRADPAGGVRFTSAGLLFISAVVYMAGLFLVLFVALPLLGYDGGMLGVIQRNIGMGLADMMAQRGSSNALEEVAESIAYVLPGLSGAWWLIILLANLAIAQRLLSRWKRQQRPDLALTRMALPRLLLVC